MGQLILHNNQVICNGCKSVFPVYSGIIDFLPGFDEFYEGKFGTHRIRFKFLRKWFEPVYTKISTSVIRTRHQRFLKNLEPGEDGLVKVLDLGCGGGSPLLQRRKGYYLVGIDLSLSSLLNAACRYNQVYKSPVFPLPFPQDCFNCVCSFDLIGHIPESEKDMVIGEIHRVLKPGGLTFHYIEVDSPKGLNRWAKRHPELYRKYFVDLDGHLGLEYYKKTLERFSALGFSELDHKVMAKVILPPGELSKRFNNEYKAKHPVLKIAVTLDSILSGNILVRTMCGISLKPLQMIIEPLFSNDYGGLLFVAHQKSG